MSSPGLRNVAYQSFTRTINQQWNNEKSHAQYHTARPSDNEQATKNAFRSVTLVYGFLTNFGAHSPGTFWLWDVLTDGMIWLVPLGHFDRWNVLTVGRFDLKLGRFDYGTFWQMGWFDLSPWDVFTRGTFWRWDVLTWSWDVLTMGRFDRWDVLTVNHYRSGCSYWSVPP